MSNQGDFLGRIRDNWQQRAGEKTTFRAELRVIPGWLRWVVLALCLAGAVVGTLVGIYQPGMLIRESLVHRVPAHLILGVLIASILSVLVLFYGYIAADAKRRGMSPVLWLLVSLLVPYLIGAILYFVIREPLPMDCPQCGRSINPHFNFCPACQFNLRPNCPQCRRAVRAGDRFCPSCGFTLQPEATSQVPAPTA
jgi:RNA polymerase subunit RPABC4/transcription elongation factor Spt4